MSCTSSDMGNPTCLGDLEKKRDALRHSHARASTRFESDRTKRQAQQTLMLGRRNAKMPSTYDTLISIRRDAVTLDAET